MCKPVDRGGGWGLSIQNASEDNIETLFAEAKDFQLNTMSVAAPKLNRASFLNICYLCAASTLSEVENPLISPNSIYIYTVHKSQIHLV